MSTENYAKATALFKELGLLTAQAIYERVKEAGIVGERGNTTQCPLALLVARELGFVVTIGGSYWSLYGDGDTHTLPDSCVEFISRVDNGDAAFADVARDAEPATPWWG
jgi:hypothetical protein